MASRTIDFDAADLAAQLDRASVEDIDALPFGVIGLSPDFVVKVYSKPEAAQSGFGRQPIGESFFPLTRRRMNTDDFRGRIERAMADGRVDLEFAWVGDYGDPKREMRVRVQSSKDGGVWICIERDTKR
jgi:photoactive yellow protein